MLPASPFPKAHVAIFAPTDFGCIRAGRTSLIGLTPVDGQPFGTKD
jgi:hypothetical protein